MGTFCCCPVPENVEEYISFPNGTLYQRCACLQGCVRWLLYMYTTIFDRFGGRELPPTQGSSAVPGLLVARSQDTSLMDTYRAPPRPLPYDVDSRYVRLPRDGLVSRRDKIGMSHLFGAAEARNNADVGGVGVGESVALLPRQSSAASADQVQDVEALEKQQSSKFLTKSESMLSLIDDEDVCPTCLDVYTEDNPKINTQCGHHFHLACILEWMERSKHCPVCDKEMVFHESTGV